MKRIAAIFLLGLSVAAVQPSTAVGQTEIHSTGGARGAIGPLGFVYSGRADLSHSPPRWADYPVVRHVYETSPAQMAGLLVGDVILKVNGRDGCEFEPYRAHAPGTPFTLVVQRGREQKEISFVLVEPNWPDSAWVPGASRR